MLGKILRVPAVIALVAAASFAIAGHAPDPARPKLCTSIDPGSLPVEHALVLGNPEGIRKLYVFTDPDCPSCRILHAELQQLERIAPGVAIYIMLYPLPIHPSAYDKARVAISRKSSRLLDDCFAGKKLPDPVGNEGKNALDAIARSAKKNGISRTPTLVMLDGKTVVGGRSAETLKQMLDGGGL